MKPKVVEPIESIGRYGGEIVVLATGPAIWGNDTQGMFGTSLFKSPRNGVGIEADVAEGWEINEDKTAITVFLREGHKWSDGHPFTTEDMRFTFEDMARYEPRVGIWGNFLGFEEFDLIDETTVRLYIEGGLGIRPLQMSSWFGGYAAMLYPAHYLKNWHPKYNPDAEALAKEEGFDTWIQAIDYHRNFANQEDVDKPQIEPWELVQANDQVRDYERNPYYHRVDQAGNQLPYIDRRIIQIVNPEVYQIKVMGGEASIAYAGLQVANLALYQESAEEGDYRISFHPGVAGSQVKLVMNQNHPDPDLRAIYNNLKFRQALSVSINRDEVNDIIYQGLGVPGQLAPLKSVSFYKDGWREHYAQYDPELANRLLDEIGLDKKDSAGFRIMPDGKVLSLVLDFMTSDFTSELELVREYFQEVGLKTTIKLTEMNIFEQRRAESDFFAWVHNAPTQPWCNERQMFQLAWVWNAEAGQAQQWNNYLSSKSRALTETLAEGEKLPENWRRLDFPEGAEIQGEEAPDFWIERAERENIWTQTEMGSPEYREIGQEVFDFYVQRLTRIGIVGEVPSLLISKNKLRNVVTPGWMSGAPLAEDYVMNWMDQMYWEE